MPLIWRQTLLEIPMNEEKLPDGTTANPHYDPKFHYGWGAYDRSTDIAMKRAQGWKLVSWDDIKDTMPDHYRDALREEGSYLVLGDLVLMRISRALREQQRVAKEERVMGALRGAGQENLQELGAHQSPHPSIRNEVTINIQE